MRASRKDWDQKRFTRNLLYVYMGVLALYGCKALYDGIWLRLSLISLVLGICLFALSSLRRSPRLAGEILLFAGFTGINLAIYTNGGLASFATLILLVVPLFAFPISTKRSSYFWFAMTLLTYCVYYVLSLMGYTPANLTVHDQRANHAFFGIMAVAIPLYFIAMKFMNIVDNYARKIKSQLRELKDEAFKRHNAEVVAQKASEAKSFFLANMSHEIRTPLNGIVGIVDLLNDVPMEDKYKQYIRTLNEASHLLLNQVNDILDFSKIESGEFQLLKTTFSIKHCLTGLASLFKLSAEEKGLAFHLQLPDNLPDAVYSDEKCVRQIISNIVSNAVKYTEQGHIRLFVDYENEQLTFCCEDTGLGISEDTLARLFTPFTQDYTEQKQFIQGTGLGLSITHSLCQLLDGSIDVESEEGKGACFRVTLPMPARASLETQFQAQHNITEFVVWVAEDNPVNQMVINGLLKKIGCPHEVYDDGEQLLAALSQAPNMPDVILSDIQMPNMNGYELIQALRTQEKWQTLHVVALTANATSEEQQRAIESGFNGFLTKPIERGKLLEYLSKI